MKSKPFAEVVNNISERLPIGWEIHIQIGSDFGNVELFNSEGLEEDFPSNHECLEDEINDAVDFAVEHK